MMEDDYASTLFLGDLSVHCTERDIRKLFRPMGTIEAIRIKRGTNAKTNLSYGFIKFSTRQAAEMAQTQLNGYMFLGRCIRIGWATGKDAPKLPSDIFGDGQEVAHVSKRESAQIHVSFISKQIDNLISEATIRSLFSNYGEVMDVALKKSQFDKNLRIQNGYGFVHYFLNPEGVQAAIDAVNSLHQVTIDRITYDCSISHALGEYLTARNIPLPRGSVQPSGRNSSGNNDAKNGGNRYHGASLGRAQSMDADQRSNNPPHGHFSAFPSTAEDYSQRKLHDLNGSFNWQGGAVFADEFGGDALDQQQKYRPDHREHGSSIRGPNHMFDEVDPFHMQQFASDLPPLDAEGMVPYRLQPPHHHGEFPPRSAPSGMAHQYPRGGRHPYDDRRDRLYGGDFSPIDNNAKQYRQQPHPHQIVYPPTVPPTYRQQPQHYHQPPRRQMPSQFSHNRYGRDGSNMPPSYGYSHHQHADFAGDNGNSPVSDGYFHEESFNDEGDYRGSWPQRGAESEPPSYHSAAYHQLPPTNVSRGHRSHNYPVANQLNRHHKHQQNDDKVLNSNAFMHEVSFDASPMATAVSASVSASSGSTTVTPRQVGPPSLSVDAFFHQQSSASSSSSHHNVLSLQPHLSSSSMGSMYLGNVSQPSQSQSQPQQRSELSPRDISGMNDYSQSLVFTTNATVPTLGPDEQKSEIPHLAVSSAASSLSLVVGGERGSEVADTIEDAYNNEQLPLNQQQQQSITALIDAYHHPHHVE